jgi:hypothetical protein
VIGRVLDKARFWMAHGAKPMNDRQRKVVNLLLNKGRGGFEGTMTNAKYVSIANTGPATAQRDQRIRASATTRMVLQARLAQCKQPQGPWYEATQSGSW